MSTRSSQQAAITAGQVANQLGVTVPTLHHDDEIGLLTPSARTPAGYRLYTGGDLDRLQHVVVYRRLGFSLDEIAELLDADAADLRGHLEQPARHGRRQAGSAAPPGRRDRRSTGEGGVRHGAHR